MILYPFACVLVLSQHQSDKRNFKSASQISHPSVPWQQVLQCQLPTLLGALMQMQEATTAAVTATDPFVMRHTLHTTGKLPLQEAVTTGKVTLHTRTHATGFSHSSEEPSESLQVTQGKCHSQQLATDTLFCGISHSSRCNILVCSIQFSCIETSNFQSKINDSTWEKGMLFSNGDSDHEFNNCRTNSGQCQQQRQCRQQCRDEHREHTICYEVAHSCGACQQ